MEEIDFIAAPSQKALVAMSGGVDSSVAALLLRREGYGCAGVTLELLEDTGSALGEAAAVAAGIGMPFATLDCRDDFRQSVIGPFCASYLAGDTPNPCIECNRHLKFGALHLYRQEHGFDFLATGHYAQVAFNESTGRYEVRRGRDASKDQSYVLYCLDQNQLAHTLLPLGALSKDEVRTLARQAGFANAQAPESQDICFIPDGDYGRFIEQATGASPAPGPIVDTEGAVLGTHRGLAFYTIGQRKGLGIAYSEPLFVLAKDAGRNTLVVGPRSQQGVSTVWARDVNFVSRTGLDGPLAVTAKASYRQAPAAAEAVAVPADNPAALAAMQAGGRSTGGCCAPSAAPESGALLQVTFEKPLRACACGQALVIYEGDAVVAGGTICAYR